MTAVLADQVSEAMRMGAEALLRRQRPDGAFTDNPPGSVLGTGGAIVALHAADPVGHADLVEGGAAWLRETQRDDGGWGGVVGAESELVPTAIGTAALRMTAPGESADAIAAGQVRLAALGGVQAITDPAIALLCRQFLTLAGLADPKDLRRLPLEVVLFDKVRRERISFRTAPFVGLALAQADLLPTGRLRRATLRRARPKALALLESIYRHEGETGDFSEDPWPAALVLLGLVRAGEGAHMARAIIGFLRRSVRPDGGWDAVTNLDLTRSGYAATGLIASGYAEDPRLVPTRDLFHARQQTQAFEILAVPAGGWSYSSARGWPVTLESAEILSALALLPGSATDPVLRRGLDWLIERQDTRGSWSLWVRNTKLANDGPCPAITSQAIMALRDAGYTADHAAVAAAATWLLTRQRPDGTFENLWYRDFTTGTGVVLAALSRAGHAGHEVSGRARDWLLRTQLDDGSWGAGDGGPGSVEETGWALHGLLAAGVPATDAVIRRGVGWLVEARLPEGGWQPTRLCNYIRHHMLYANGVITQGVALRALGEYLRAAGGSAV